MKGLISQLNADAIPAHLVVEMLNYTMSTKNAAINLGIAHSELQAIMHHYGIHLTKDGVFEVRQRFIPPAEKKEIMISGLASGKREYTDRVQYLLNEEPEATIGDVFLFKPVPVDYSAVKEFEHKVRIIKERSAQFQTNSIKKTA